MRPCAQKLDTQTPCVKEAATAAINTLASLGYSAVIFGGLACSLYGAPRAPKDADILALPPSNEANTEDTEVLKNAIMRTDSTRFYTVRARDPGATYRVLYFRSDGHEPWKCKVDILLPGILHLPALPTARIVWIEGFPVIPFALLLLQKLQAYDDHRHSREQHKFTRSQQDEEDINKLLDIRERVLEVIQEHPWHDRAVFSEEFMTLSRKRVAEYARIFIETWLWRDLGFTI
ncbi:hypothetical protein BD626DRAFT_406073 [Schizophyllum amplum]|uniref:Polymerase nucleotidyl transferase domain-containing protein n=1 Tax=Schizophyllum amplum TaxID=97359 RepID=A0A550C9C6_9AGAR|nr:hypothetical protein BD626DRAFT_406073 [Auriculariopsis ampla]